MTNAAIYTRISHDPTHEELGMQRHYEDCAELANRLGWNVVHHYDDNDISAYNGKVRPEYEAMLGAMEAGELDAIICWHPDRLYRSLKDLERLIEIADARRIELRTVNGGDFDLSTSTGRMVARILGSVSRQESEHKGERHRSANAQARAAGKWRNGGAAVFGYDAKGQVVEHERVLIRSAASDLLAGRSLRSLAREWTENGIPTRRGGPWSANGFREMIGNPRYAALMTHKEPGGIRQIVGKGEWEQIIDEDTHYAIAALLSDPARRSQQSIERVHIGSGVYVCGICGDTLRPVSIKKARGGKRTVDYGCRTGFHLSVSGKALDAHVEEWILGWLARDDVSRYTGDDTEDVAELARRRDGLRARLDGLGLMCARGEIDESQLRVATAELRQQMEGLNSLLASLLRTSPAANLLNGDGDLSERWNATSAEMRGRIIDELVTVTVNPVGQARGRWGRIEDRVVIAPK